MKGPPAGTEALPASRIELVHGSIFVVALVALFWLTRFLNDGGPFPL